MTQPLHFILMSLPVLILTEIDAGRVVELHTGDQFLVVLSGNPTTGYQWLITALSKKILRPVGEPEYQNSSDLVGSGGVFRFLFESVGVGETTLRFAYKRPFEVGKRPLMGFKAIIKVTTLEF